MNKVILTNRNAFQVKEFLPVRRTDCLCKKQVAFFLEKRSKLQYKNEFIRILLLHSLNHSFKFAVDKILNLEPGMHNLLLHGCMRPWVVSSKVMHSHLKLIPSQKQIFLFMYTGKNSI